MNIAQATISGTRMDQETCLPPGSSDVIAAEPLDDGAPNTGLISGTRIFCGIDHIPNIGPLAFRQKQRAGIAVLVAAFGLLAACSGTAVVESSEMAVTVRYSAMDGVDAASELAQKACAAHRKTARLRNTANFGLTDRYAHFDCI